MHLLDNVTSGVHNSINPSRHTQRNLISSALDEEQYESSIKHLEGRYYGDRATPASNFFSRVGPASFLRRPLWSHRTRTDAPGRGIRLVVLAIGHCTVPDELTEHNAQITAVVLAVASSKLRERAGD
jgi:hypothetical protein